TAPGSWSSERGVRPTRWPNRTEIRRRSDSGAGARGSASSAAPHSPQKRSAGSFAAPQAGQARASGAPQFEQNFRPARFSVPQAEQVMAQLTVICNGRAGKAGTASRSASQATPRSARPGQPDEAVRSPNEDLAAVEDVIGARVGANPACVAEHRVDVEPGRGVAVERG